MAWRWANAWEFYFTSSIHPFIFPPTAALATYYLTSTRFIACKTLSLGRYPCMLSFFLFPYVSVIPCGWWWNHAWCAWPCCIYHRCCSCYLCLLLNILSGRWGEGQYCCSFLIFVFHPMSCGYWCAQELEHICIGIWLLGWWQAGRYFHWVMGLKCGVYKYTCHPIIPPCTCFWKHLTWLCPFRYLHEKPYAQVSAKLCAS